MLGIVHGRTNIYDRPTGHNDRFCFAAPDILRARSGSNISSCARSMVYFKTIEEHWRRYILVDYDV